MKKFFATMVSLALILGSFPLAVLADSDVNDDEQTATIEETDTVDETDPAEEELSETVIDSETVSEEPSLGVTVPPVESWNDLLQAIENAGSTPTTLTLAEDCQSNGAAWDQIVISAGQNITINLNGHDLNRQMNDYDTQSGMVIMVNYGANLTIIGDNRNRGTICGGKCEKGGGISNYGTLTLQDCVVSGNNATVAGGGVYCSSDSVLNIQGYVSIDSNSVGQTPDNIYLDGSSVITVTGAVDPASSIHVSGNVEKFITSNWQTQSGITDESIIQSVVAYDDSTLPGPAMYANGELGLNIPCLFRWTDSNYNVLEELRLPPEVPHRITSSDETLSPGWYYVTGDVNIGFLRTSSTASADYNIILTDYSHLNVARGILHTNSRVLRFFCQSEEVNALEEFNELEVIDDDYTPSPSGRLTVHGENGQAGIGGGDNDPCGAIEIAGGFIAAYGGNNQPGIGGSYTRNDSGMHNISILGGSIRAYGGNSAAGIGGSYNTDITTGSILICGGYVHAEGGKFGAGIGGGDNGDLCVPIDIYGGTVRARGGIGGGAGIGAGFEADMAGSISISGGYVDSWGMDGGACIGAGCASQVVYWDGDWRGPISITGGTVHLSIKSSNEYNRVGYAIGIGLLGDRADGAALILGADRSVVQNPDVPTRVRVTAAEREHRCCYIPDPYDPADDPYTVLLIEECPHDNLTYPLDHATSDYHWGRCTACEAHPTEPHTYNDAGVCTVCNYSPAAPADPQFVGSAMRLDSGELYLQIFFTVNDSVDNTRERYVTLSSQHIDNIRIPSDLWQDGSEKTGYDSYMVQVGVSSIMMAEGITPTLHYYINGEDDPHEVSSQAPYSVINYITALNDSSYITDRERTIVRAMADYGYYAQLYLSALNGWTIGIDYATVTTHYSDVFPDDTVRAAIPEVQRLSSSLDHNVIESATYSVRFGDRLSVRIYLKPVSYADFNPDSIQVEGVPADSVTVAPASGNRYAVTITGLPATGLGHTVTVNYEDSSITLCPASYIYDMLGQDDSGYHVQGKNLVCALYYYAEALVLGT